MRNQHIISFITPLQDGDDDDLDLFGDETEEDKKAADERAAAKASTKKKESMLYHRQHI
jgi:hypothetical protein